RGRGAGNAPAALPPLSQRQRRPVLPEHGLRAVEREWQGAPVVCPGRAVAVGDRRDRGGVAPPLCRGGACGGPGRPALVQTAGGGGAGFKEPPVSTPGPTLIKPAARATLANGPGSKGSAWELEWSEVPGATRYHLFVIGPTASFPIINNPTLTSPSFQTAIGG